MFKKFNDFFLDFFHLKGKHKTPSVLFFKLIDKEIQDVRVVELQQDNYLFAFEELYEIIEDSIRSKLETNIAIPPKENKFVKFTVYTFKILYSATLEYFLGKGYDNLNK